MIPVLEKLWQKDQANQPGLYTKLQASLGLIAKHYPKQNKKLSPPAVKGLLLAANLKYAVALKLKERPRAVLNMNHLFLIWVRDTSAKKEAESQEYHSGSLHCHRIQTHVGNHLLPECSLPHSAMGKSAGLGLGGQV